MKEIKVENFNRTNIKIWINSYTRKEMVEFAVYCAELVIYLYTGNSDAPKNAIQAAKNWILNPSEENVERCKLASYAAADFDDNAAHADYAAVYAAFYTVCAATVTADDNDVYNADELAAHYAAGYAADAAGCAADAAGCAIKEKIVNYILNKEKPMKTKTEYVKVDMTNSEIAKAMIDGEVFFNKSGTVRYRWNENHFDFELVNAMGCGGIIERLCELEFHRKIETPITKWDNAIEHIENLKGTMVVHGDNITINVCTTEYGLLDLAHILLEGDEE